jgi:hypothetical protein
MKITIVSVVVGGIITLTSPTASGQQSYQKASESGKEIAATKKDLSEVAIDSAADFQKFKELAGANLRENQQKIVALKTKKSVESKEVKENYDKRIIVLEQKNNKLKKEIEESASIKTVMWPSFKRQFNHDIIELRNAIKEAGVRNTN